MVTALVDTRKNDRLDGVTLFDALADVHRDYIIFEESACDLHFAAVVVAERYTREVNTVFSNDRDVGIATAEYEGIVGNPRHGIGGGNVQCESRVHPGIERRVRVRQIDLNPHRARILS